MKKVLGLDLGTNSIGWALVKQDEGEYTLLEKGVDIFQEGVAREKNNEKPAVEDRTAARAARRHYFRRRLRKIELLKVLIRYGLCPPLSDEQLDEWRRKKVYPLDASFLQWQRTNDALNKNPYYDRYRALNQTLELGEQADRYTLGRALYHLVQRRGFISNRKDAEKQSEEGKVKSSIKELNQEMEQCGCRYLGEYFYRLYEQKKPIRKKYTSRNEHCLAELKAICRQQHLPQEWEKDLERAIFYQRPLKSQKGLVGKCTFEKSKNRCPASHPLFEEFRMLAFIRNIRMAAPGEKTAPSHSSMPGTHPPAVVTSTPASVKPRARTTRGAAIRKRRPAALRLRNNRAQAAVASGVARNAVCRASQHRRRDSVFHIIHRAFATPCGLSENSTSSSRGGMGFAPLFLTPVPPPPKGKEGYGPRACRPGPIRGGYRAA